MLATMETFSFVRHLSPPELEALERAFQARMDEKCQPQHRVARLRIWLVFLLLRYGALRLGEALGNATLDLAHGLVRVSGPHARSVALPGHILPTLRQRLAEAGLCPDSNTTAELTKLDPGYVRRVCYARAADCALPPDLAAPKALRQSRAIELIQTGMPLPAVQQFLGQPSLESVGEFLVCTPEDLSAMTTHYLAQETRHKTSARNVFPCWVQQMRCSGILAEVVLTSLTGLELVAIITEESLENLALAPGKTVRASVKAPFVIIGQPQAKTSARNFFNGLVDRVNRSDIVCEVVVQLPEGSKVCALITTESADCLHIQPGSEVSVQFKAFAVILSLD